MILLFISYLTVIGLLIAMAAFWISLVNGSRCTFEQAIERTKCSESELQELIQGKYLSYRKTYFIAGPRTLDVNVIPGVHASYLELQRVRKENEATLRRIAEEMAAEIAEANRRYQEQMRTSQEDLERMRRIHAEILKNMRMQLSLAPPEVIDALRILGLPKDASFEHTRQQYRLLVKRYHPDTGGDPQRFIQITAAYERVVSWLQV